MGDMSMSDHALLHQQTMVQQLHVQQMHAVHALHHAHHQQAMHHVNSQPVHHATADHMMAHMLAPHQEDAHSPPQKKRKAEKSAEDKGSHLRVRMPHNESAFLQFICATLNLQEPREAMILLLNSQKPFDNPKTIKNLREVFMRNMKSGGLSAPLNTTDFGHLGTGASEEAPAQKVDTIEGDNGEWNPAERQPDFAAFKTPPDWSGLGIKREKSRRPRRRLWSTSEGERVKTTQRRARLIPIETVLKSLCKYLREDLKDVIKAMMEDMSFKENEEYVRYAKLPRKEPSAPSNDDGQADGQDENENEDRDGGNQGGTDEEIDHLQPDHNQEDLARAISQNIVSGDFNSIFSPRAGGQHNSGGDGVEGNIHHEEQETHHHEGEADGHGQDNEHPGSENGYVDHDRPQEHHDPGMHHNPHEHHDPHDHHQDLSHHHHHHPGAYEQQEGGESGYNHGPRDEGTEEEGQDSAYGHDPRIHHHHHHHQ